MALSDEEIERKARALLDGRMESVRGLVHGSAKVDELRNQLAAAERDFVALYSAATRAGWTVEELKQLGISEPDVTQRRKRAAKKSAAPAAS